MNVTYSGMSEGAPLPDFTPHEEVTQVNFDQHLIDKDISGMGYVINIFKDVKLIASILELLQLPKSEPDRINVQQVALNLHRLNLIKSIYGEVLV